MKSIVTALFNSKYSYWVLPFFIGLYPFLFYYSNNFASINSVSHLLYFLGYFFGIPYLVFGVLQLFFTISDTLRQYKTHVIFVTIIMCVCTLMSYASYLTYKKKALVVILVVSILLSLKLHQQYKKLIVLVLLMTILPILKNGVHLYDQFKNAEWLTAPEDIGTVTFKKSPNVYLIQPDGYVGPQMMKSDLYNHTTDLYDWLETNSFKVYDNFRSNYPASLASNSSMFAMKHHYFGGSLINTIEVPRARDMIVGESPVTNVFKKNGYSNYFVVQDEYFQQNKGEEGYDYYNIEQSEIPSFCNGNMVKKVVFEDLKKAMKVDDSNTPKFFFVEKLLPHHVHFYAPGDRVAAERKEYLEKIDEVSEWLKVTVSYIQKEDPTAIIIILADHGGWVGIENYNEMFSTQDEAKIASIYSAIAAIQWNGHLNEGYDTELKSNVNLFRVLFSVLSENKSYLENLEDNSSYNLSIGNPLYNQVVKVIDDSGAKVYEKQ